MSKQVTLTLSDELYQQAQRWAAITQQDLDEALIDALRTAISPASDDPPSNNPIASLSDDELLARCEAAMDPAKGQRLRLLLEKERMGMLSPGERRELDTLVYLRNQIWVQQSEAWEEAERRGLREPSLA